MPHCGRHQIGGWREFIDQTCGQRLRRRSAITRDQHLQGGGLPNATRQTSGSAPTGHEAERRARRSEARVVSRHAAMAGQSQIESAAEAESANRRDDGQRRSGDSPAYGLAEACKFESSHAIEFRDLFEAGADSE